MTIPTPFKLDVVVFTSPAVTFSDIEDNNVQTQIETKADGPAGHPSQMFAAVVRAKPMIEFTTHQLDLIASNIPVWGINPSVTLYQKLSTGVAPVSRSATSHRKFVMSQCIAYWSEITLPSRDLATAKITLCSIYDGTNLPIVPTSSVALPGTLSSTNYFEAGPVWVTDDAGSPVTTNMTNIDSISISSGAKYRGDGDCASIYDTYGEVTTEDTVVTIKTKTALNVSTWPEEGTALTAFRFFARAFKNKGSFVADGTASHIKFSGTSGLLVPVNTMASGQNLYADTFKLIALSPDGTTPPIVMTISQAIA